METKCGDVESYVDVTSWWGQWTAKMLRVGWGDQKVDKLDWYIVID